MSANQDRDINDIFEDILLTEERVTKNAFAEGVTDGVAQGSVEAYHMGFHKGAQLGKELASYYATMSQHLESNAEISEKFVKHSKDLQAMIDAFPRTNDKEVDFEEKLDKIRALFKKITTNLKIETKPVFVNNKLSF